MCICRYTLTHLQSARLLNVHYPPRYYWYYWHWHPRWSKLSMIRYDTTILYHDTIPRYNDTTILQWCQLKSHRAQTLKPWPNRAEQISSTKHSTSCIYYVLYVPIRDTTLPVQAFISIQGYVQYTGSIHVCTSSTLGMTRACQ